MIHILRRATLAVCIFLLVPTVSVTHAGIEPPVSPEIRHAAPGMATPLVSLASEAACWCGVKQQSIYLNIIGERP